MGFFQRINGALARFMYGRNGWDQLNQALFRGYLILWIAEIILFFLHKGMAVRFLQGVLLFLMIAIFFRCFSKSLSRRRAENQKWVNWYCGVKNRSAGAKARHAGGPLSGGGWPECASAVWTGSTNTSPARTARLSAGCRWEKEKSSSPAPNAARRFRRRAEKGVYKRWALFGFASSAVLSRSTQAQKRRVHECRA